MSLTPLSPPVPTGETGGLHSQLDTVEAALDYALIKKERNETNNEYELWEAVYDALAQAADSKSGADVAAARQRLVEAIAVAQGRA